MNQVYTFSHAFIGRKSLLSSFQFSKLSIACLVTIDLKLTKSRHHNPHFQYFYPATLITSGFVSSLMLSREGMTKIPLKGVWVLSTAEMLKKSGELR